MCGALHSSCPPDPSCCDAVPFSCMFMQPLATCAGVVGWGYKEGRRWRWRWSGLQVMLPAHTSSWLEVALGNRCVHPTASSCVVVGGLAVPCRTTSIVNVLRNRWDFCSMAACTWRTATAPSATITSLACQPQAMRAQAGEGRWRRPLSK